MMQHSSNCGAELWSTINEEGLLAGVSPDFAGPSRIRLRVEEKIEVEFGASIIRGQMRDIGDTFPPTEKEKYVDQEGQFHLDMGLPIEIECPTYHICGKEVPLGSIRTAQVAAFAHEIHIFDHLQDYKKYQDDQGEDQIKLAAKCWSQGLLKVGQYNLAIFAGHVLKAERKINERTGEWYFWAQVETFGGCKLDVVIHPLLLDPDHPPRSGSYLFGAFFLSGRLFDED
jgi:hypothetical protein